MNTNIPTRSMTLLFALLATSVVHAGVIVTDDFEQGDWQSFWSPRSNVSISSDRTKDGAYAAKFTFPAGATVDDTAWSEVRFDLGAYYNELLIRFDLYVPENYIHRDSGGSDNNKFFRLWSETYDDREKIGASLMNQGSTGDSLIGSDYRVQATYGMSTAIKSAPDFITNADRGKWMAVGIYVKAATDTSPAQLKIYKNGLVFLEDSRDINYVPGTQGYRRGYLLGWANSGFAEETIFYMDNVQFYDVNIMSSAPEAPSRLTLR